MNEEKKVDIDDLYSQFQETDTRKRSQEDISRDIKYVDERLWEKLERVGKKISFANDIIALYRYMMDRYVSWHRKAIVVAALIYFISPIDAIPDIAPLVGYMDDLGVLTALMKYLGHELIPYYKD